ncbi:MAG TPA: N-acetyltransferase [Balneolaceae bacterium]
MINEIIVRAEQQKDLRQINQIIKSAFQKHPHSNQKEHLLVSDLRKNGALTVSLVAESDKNILGHIAFSEVTIINGKNHSWYGLAPVSVDPGYQNQGVGSKLVREGLNELKSMGAKGCVLVGEPDYYGRFGFRQYEELTLEGIPSEFFLALPFYQKVPSGCVDYHKVFAKYG